MNFCFNTNWNFHLLVYFSKLTFAKVKNLIRLPRLEESYADVYTFICVFILITVMKLGDSCLNFLLKGKKLLLQNLNTNAFYTSKYTGIQSENDYYTILSPYWCDLQETHIYLINLRPKRFKWGYPIPGINANSSKY